MIRAIWHRAKQPNIRGPVMLAIAFLLGPFVWPESDSEMTIMFVFYAFLPWVGLGFVGFTVALWDFLD